MSIANWKRKALGRHPMGGDGGGGGGGGDYSGVDAAMAGASMGGAQAGPSVGGNVDFSGLADFASIGGAPSTSSGPAAGTPGPGKAGETAVGGTGLMGGSAASTAATAEMMGRSMSPSSAIAQLESPAMASAPGFSTNGISKAALEGLSAAGLGSQSLSSSQTVDQARAAINVHDNVMPVVAGLITSAVPGGAMAIAGAKALGAVSSGQLTATEAAKGFFGNLIAGQLNQAIMGALPSGVSSAISAANQVATAGKMFGLDLSSINPGRSVVDAVLGGPSMSSTGPVSSGGASVEYGDFGRPDDTGTPATPNGSPVTTPNDSPVTTPTGLSTNMRFNLSRAGDFGRAIRSGAMSRGGRNGLHANR